MRAGVPNGSKMGSTWVQNGSKVGPKWVQNRSKLETIELAHPCSFDPLCCRSFLPKILSLILSCSLLGSASCHKPLGRLFCTMSENCASSTSELACGAADARDVVPSSSEKPESTVQPKPSKPGWYLAKLQRSPTPRGYPYRLPCIRPA